MLGLSRVSREKVLITSFFLAGLADIGSTAIALSLAGFREVGLNGARQVAAGSTVNALVFRMAVTAFMIGMYALCKHWGHGRLAYAFEKTLTATTPLAWGVALLNVFQIGLYVALSHAS